MLPPGLVRRDESTADEVRCWDADLESLCASVDDVFRRPASRENLRAMVRGLLSDVPRKNMWQVAEAAGHASPDRLQDFLARAPGMRILRDRVREFVVDSLRAQDAVLIADETGDIKKGTKSAGVARQHTGVTGQVKNAQVSVHLSYGSSRGRAIIDRELYAGQHWAGRGEEHRHRCEEAAVLEERARTVVTKPEPARRMVERALAAGVVVSRLRGSS
jgi:SRSO17 transposase